MNNPYQDDGPTGNKQSSKIHSGPWGDMFAEFDGPSKNLEQALYKVKHNGKYLTKDQRRKYYDVLHNNQSFKQIAEWIGYGDALKQVVIRSGPDAKKSHIRYSVFVVYIIKNG